MVVPQAISKIKRETNSYYIYMKNQIKELEEEAKHLKSVIDNK